MPARFMARALFLLVLAVGCTHIRNTPAQDLAWERWQRCSHFPNITLKEIRLNGEVWVFTGDGSHGLGPWRTCMQDARVAQRAEGRAATAQPALEATEARELVRFAYFTTEAPARGTFLRSAMFSNMPQRVAAFRNGAPVTFFYAITQLGRVLNTDVRWINPKGDMVKVTRQAVDQSTAPGTGTWVWRTDTHLPSGFTEGGWVVELLIDGHTAGRYDFTVAPR